MASVAITAAEMAAFDQCSPALRECLRGLNFKLKATDALRTERILGTAFTIEYIRKIDMAQCKLVPPWADVDDPDRP